MLLDALKHWLKRLAPRSSTRASRRPPRPAVSLRVEELEGASHPTGNLAITSVSVVDSNENPLTPAIGEGVFIRADYTTLNLPANASYSITYTVDGVTLSTGNITFGAGASGTGTWNYYWGSWYAAPGVHNVSVTVDPDQSVAETSYADNTATTSFTPVHAPDLPQKFITPIGGTPFQTWGIVNYVDVNPTSPTFKDYLGRDYTYDGHTGHDITLANFTSMDAGVPDIAAASGTVAAVQDGNYDRNTSFSTAPANYVDIDLGNGWHTIYYHFRADSILVHVGDHVTQGQILGLAGSSGDSTLAHLHFELQHNGDVVEEEYDPNTFWQNPLPYQRNIRSVLDSGISSDFTTAVSDLTAEERPVSANVFTQAAGQQLTLWFDTYTAANDTVSYQFYRPDGTADPTFRGSAPAGEGRGSIWHYYYPASGMALGTWRATISINGTVMATDTFQVTAAGAAAAHVAQGTTYIPNGRTTPVDFGTVARGAAPPQLTFTVANLGSAALSLSNLSLPTGLSLVGSFPSSVAVGGSAAFTVQMATATSASVAGILSFNTNDPIAPSYGFDVSGTVSGGNPGALHGQVYHDANADGVENGGDVGQQGWTVQLLNPADNSVLATTTTGYNGYYKFLNLAPGTYRVREVPLAGYTQTTANPADVPVTTTDVLVSPFGTITLWRAVSQTVAPSGDTRLLWDNPNGSAIVWDVNTATRQVNAGPVLGPYAGWTAIKIDVAGDGTSRVLWRTTGGAASIWTLDANGNSLGGVSYGPYADWTAVDINVGTDGNTRLLWNRTDGTAALWNVNTATGQVIASAGYGPYSGWTATHIAVGPDGNTRLLWNHVTGQASLWVLDASGTYQSSVYFGPYLSWTAVAISVGSDNNTRLLWDRTDGTASLYDVNTGTGQLLGATYYGPFAGWTATAVATGPGGRVRLLWEQTSGQESLWSLDANGISQGALSFGPY